MLIDTTVQNVIGTPLPVPLPVTDTGFITVPTTATATVLLVYTSTMVHLLGLALLCSGGEEADENILRDHHNFVHLAEKTNKTANSTGQARVVE